MGDVTEFTGLTRLPSDPQRVLELACGANLSSVVVIGFDAGGNEYFHASDADGGDVLWHLARAQHKLLSVPERFDG